MRWVINYVLWCCWCARMFILILYCFLVHLHVWLRCGSICLPHLLLCVILVVLNRHLSCIILWWPRCIALEPCLCNLKLKFSQYSSIHTNCIIPHSPLYNIIIIFETVLRQKRICKREDNEFNSAAISLLWHPPAMLCSGKINVAGIRRR